MVLSCVFVNFPMERAIVVVSRLQRRSVPTVLFHCLLQQIRAFELKFLISFFDKLEAEHSDGCLIYLFKAITFCSYKIKVIWCRV